MKLKINFYFTLFFLFIASIYLNSCSVIGLAIGAHSDSGKPDSTTVSVSHLSAIKYGEKITVKLIDGNRINGYYLGYKQFSFLSYKKQYNNFLKSLTSESNIPRIGEHIQIRTFDKRSIEGALLGFDSDKIYVTLGDKTYSSLMLNQIEKIINAQGRLYPVDTILKLISSPGFPLYSEEKVKKEPELGIAGEYGKKYYSLKVLKQIMIPTKKNGKVTGFLIGAAIDAIVVIYVISSFEYPSFSLGSM